jgi:hypothetical protein
VNTQELSLGPFSFDGLASPARLVFKNKQRIVVHQLGSGLLATDSLGDDLQSVSFKGTFTGPEATSRARSLDYLRAQGTVLTLAWESLLLPVIIHELELVYSSNLWITYELSCNVIRSIDANDITTTSPALPSPATQVTDILNTLQTTSMSMTQAQATALSELAALDFDAPPAAALQASTDLLNRIDGSIDNLNLLSEDSGIIDQTLSQTRVSNLWNLVSTFGQIALLILAKNRTSSIISAASKVNT